MGCSCWRLSLSAIILESFCYWRLPVQLDRLVLYPHPAEAFDISALMGYTWAHIQNFMGTLLVYSVLLELLLLWVVLPWGSLGSGAGRL